MNIMSSLYQHGTLAMLMGKQLQGTITVAELLTHGDTGIGTLTGLDGEVIVLDGEVYQATSDGKLNHITDKDTKMPFVSVHFDQPTRRLPFSETSTDTLSQQLKSEKLTNIFAAVKFHGDFSNMHVRVAQKQETPYPSLLEVATNQSEFQEKNISGTIVGYFAPSVFSGPTAAGWHIHFLSDDKKFGGHILDFEGQNIDGTLQIFDEFRQHFPLEDSDFRDMSLNLEGLSDDIATSEGGKQ